METAKSYRVNGTMEFHPASNRIVRSGSEEIVERMMVDVATFLIENRDRPVGHEELIQKFWGPTVKGKEVMVKSISKLRKIFGADAIRTIPKTGYQWVAATEELVWTKTKRPSIFNRYSGKELLIRGALVLGAMMILRGIFFPHH